MSGERLHMTAKEVREALDEQLGMYAEAPVQQDFVSTTDDTSRLVDGKIISDPSNATTSPEQPVRKQ